MASYYVDPSIDSDSGAGTIGDPYGDLQYALDSITRDTTNGDQINIKAGTAEILTATLDVSTYGTPTFAAGLAFVGYTSAENDGGVGEIDGDGIYGIWINSTAEGVVFKDLTLGNCGSADVINFDRFCSLRRCKIHGTTADGVDASATTSAIECWFTDIGGKGIASQSISAVDCLFTNGTNTFTAASNASVHIRCCFSLTSTSDAIDNGTGIPVQTSNCSFYTTGTGSAISCRPIYGVVIEGCLFQGWGTAIDYSATTEIAPGGYNFCVFYDNTTDADSAEFDGLNEFNESLGANLFDLSGSITSFADRLTYFNPVDQGNVYTDMPGGLVKGAVQPASGGGGGAGTLHPLRSTR